MTRIIIFSKGSFRRGYIALVSVMLLVAVAGAIMVSIIASGISASNTDFSIQQSGSARSMASSCAEEGLQKILESGTTSASGNLILASGTCSYLIFVNSGHTTINATGTLGTVVSKIKVVVASTTPSVTLSSWEEVPDF